VTLSKKDKDVLRTASRQAARDYFASLSESLRRKGWIGLSNRYRVECAQTFKQDVQKNAVNRKHVTAYVCGSGPAHAIDGWSFLARSVESLIAGDAYTSIHLAYYSELRAAMALLASQGVGIFNHQHPVLSSASVKHIKGNTHEKVWSVLDHWAGLADARLLIDSLVCPQGIPLSRWLDATGVKAPLSAIGQRWFRIWGVDLKAFVDDRKARNLASYRPASFRPTKQLSANEVAEFLASLWALFEPTAGSRFANLDRVLLKVAFVQLGGVVDKGRLERELALSSPAAAEWATYLNSPEILAPVTLAEKSSKIEEKTAPLEVISRAALLLALATLANRALLVQAGFSLETIAHYWHDEVRSRGLVLDGTPPDDPKDFWEDVSASISDAEDWAAKNVDPTVTPGMWRKAQPPVLLQLAAFELAGIWGLSP
jgi:hypothetical protein